MASTDFTGLANTLGAYARTQGKGLIRKAYLDPKFQDTFTVLEGNKDELFMPTLKVGQLIRPSKRNGSWEPNQDTIAMDAKIMKVFPIKMDLEFIPEMHYNTWANLSNTPGTTAYKMPFEQYIMEDVVNKIFEEIYLASMQAVRNNNGTNFSATMNGANKLIADAITANTITPVAAPTFTTSNVRENLIAIHNSLDERVKGKTDLQLILPASVYDLYMQKFDPLVNQNNEVQKKPTFLYGTNAKLIRNAAQNTNRVICTPKSNLFMGFDLESDATNFQVEQSKRVINIFCDFVAGVDIADLDYVACNTIA